MRKSPAWLHPQNPVGMQADWRPSECLGLSLQETNGSRRVLLEHLHPESHAQLRCRCVRQSLRAPIPSGQASRFYIEATTNRSDCNTPDQACTRCRERKIRCDRERPRCANCEKEDGASCDYQTPPKRVNHLKLLCDSVDQLQGRLANIESHLQRLTLSPEQSQEQNTPLSLNGCLSGGKERSERCEDEGYVRRQPSVGGLDQAEQEDTEVNRSCVGPFSLVALCERLRECTLSSHNPPVSSGLSSKLQTLCETAAVTETLPSCSDEPPVLLPPRQQAMAAIERFSHFGDCITDLFVPSHLLANLESIYAQPHSPGDTSESWTICFKTIIVLALGIEIAGQHSNATFFGDFARSLLPSRAALITPRLLTTPKLINVQVLILLSVAAQQFDPPGWAESIFAHACMLARMIGLHQTQLRARNYTDVEAVERGMVLRSLYVRDRSLCMSRGALSWLPSHDCDIVNQLNEGIERRAPHAVRLQLAVIQDEVHLLNQTAYSCTSTSLKKVGASLQSIERQLERFAATFSIFNLGADHFSPYSALITLEFLATRILALRHSSNPIHVERVRSDARASCLLLLIANGLRDQETINRFHSLIGTAASSQTIGVVSLETAAVPVTSPLDAFSIPAYFILNEDLMGSFVKEEKSTLFEEDLGLLRKVSECYTCLTGWMQSNSYNLKVARVLSQVLDITETLRHGHNGSIVSSPEDGSMGSVLSSHRRTVPHAIDSSITGELPDGSLSTVSDWPVNLGSSSLAWDNWLSASSLMGPATPLGAVPGVSNVSSPSQDLLTQLLTAPHTVSDGIDLPMLFQGLNPTGVSPRKRPRLDEQQPSHCLHGR
ncbi:hypothetical protein BJX99DRAFT_192633 [Aspergillus californicus]